MAATETPNSKPSMQGRGLEMGCKAKELPVMLGDLDLAEVLTPGKLPRTKALPPNAKRAMAIQALAESPAHQAFDAIQAGQVYAKVIRTPDKSLVETVFPSLTEVTPHVEDRPEKTVMPKAGPRADRAQPSPDRTADALEVAPETQPAAQLPAPLSHRGR